MVVLCRLIVFSLAIQALGLEDMLEFPSVDERSSEICCNEEALKSCQSVNIRAEDFLKAEITFHGVVLQFSNEHGHGRDYKNAKGDEAFISYNKANGHFFANLDTHDGRIFTIEACHNGHVFKEMDMEKQKPSGPLTPPASMLPQAPAQDNVMVTDTTTVVTYSMMFYYTKEFAAVTADIEGFVDYAVELTNQGYINSKIPVRIEKFCIEETTMSQAEAVDIRKWTYSKGTVKALRNTADMATLLVTSAPYCGIAWLVDAEASLAVSINVKGCIGGFVLGHEIGHNFGCHHDQYQKSLYPSRETNPYYAYGYGHHIEPGKASQGYRTILAYNKRGFSARVNYHSNPDVILPATGTPTGIRGRSNNAAIFIKNRFKMASHGDESDSCKKQDNGGYQGCFEDCNPVTLPYRQANSNSMTPKLCQDTCARKGFAYAGVQFYYECFCGNSLPPVKKPESECNRPCLGDNTQICGGSCRNSVYRTSASTGEGTLKAIQVKTCDASADAVYGKYGACWHTVCKLTLRIFSAKDSCTHDLSFQELKVGQINSFGPGACLSKKYDTDQDFSVTVTHKGTDGWLADWIKVTFDNGKTVQCNMNKAWLKEADGPSRKQVTRTCK